MDLTARFIIVWQRNMRVFRRFIWSNIVSGFVEPLVFLLGMGFGIGQFVKELNGIPYTAFIAPGIIASSAMFAASFESTFGTFIRMTFQKTFDAIIATPVSIDEVVAGELLYSATKAVVSGTVILLAIFLFGLVPQFHPTALLIPLAAALVGLLFAAAGMIIASVVPSIETFNYYITLVITPMFVFSGIFFPIDSLPGFAQSIAWFTPLMHAVRLMRGLVLGQTGHLWADSVWLAVVAALLLPWPLLLMRRKLIK
ncbi:MAG TPA: ABC transporter permease [Symbiobacteriaceae bacterium]|nr:ABC transporter permease [Symbiobacteriaceae bacterium]